jgi:glycosyltransferase involved in cell wall biosynthesis
MTLDLPINLTINGRFLTQPLTGVQRYAREFVTTLDQLLLTGDIDPQDWQVRLLHPNRPISAPLSLVQIQQQGVGKTAGHLWEQGELPKFIGPDILLCLGNAAPLWQLWRSHPTVVTVHDLSYRYFPQAYSRAYRLAYGLITPAIMQFATAIITVSASERNAILGCYPQSQDRLHVIANGGFPASARSQSLSLDQLVPAEHPWLFTDKPFLLYVGSLSRRKNLAGVLQALTRLNQYRQLDLVVIGAGSQILEQVDLEGPVSIGDRIHFIGQINNFGILSHYYRAAQALVFPSFYESSGLPPLEAMACGCPVIVSDIPALVERCGDAALYCQAEDVESICQAISQLLDHPQLSDQLRQKGYQQAAKFSWQTCVQQTLELIQQVTRSR